jgi:hypothetical protein
MCAHGVTVPTARRTLGVELTRLPTPGRVDDTDRCDVLAEPLTLPPRVLGDELASCAEAVAIAVSRRSATPDWVANTVRSAGQRDAMARDYPADGDSNGSHTRGKHKPRPVAALPSGVAAISRGAG